MLILNELAHQFPSQINIQHSWHGFSFFLGAVVVSSRRSQFDFDAERLQHRKHLAKLARWFPLFHFDDEPQASAGGHGQPLLGHTHGFAGVFG